MSTRIRVTENGVEFDLHQGEVESQGGIGSGIQRSFQGQVVPVDLVLCDIAERYGFCVDEVVIARYKGNSSQQMGRYGRIPVRESIVVWRKP